MSFRAYAPRGRWLLGILAAVLATSPAAAQEQPFEIVTVARGASVLLTHPSPIERISIGDPEVADAVVVSPQEVLVNARTLGTTSLYVWGVSGERRLYSVEVTADAGAIERQLQALFPGEDFSVTASGNVVILSGRIQNAEIGRRALEIAQATGANVIDNLVNPAPQQILLQVRFAEVSRTATRALGTEFRVGETAVSLNPGGAGSDGDWLAETLSDGLVRLFLFADGVQVDAVIRALRSDGHFKSLAEPNLLAIEGEEASFLAGGEFPFPIPQPGAGNTVTIMFKEYGIRLAFTPHVTPEGSIRLAVAPEVSSLDFANGLELSGFRIPSLLTRRFETDVELRAGQTLAIAGLLDNTIQDNEGRIPFLGDIPILGALFRSRDIQQNRTELVVLVTPTLVQPANAPPPTLGGEPETWDWAPHLRDRVSTPDGR